jgi:hypothetical protein
MSAKSARIDLANLANPRGGISVEQIGGSVEEMIRSLGSLGSSFSPGLELAFEIE